VLATLTPQCGQRDSTHRLAEILTGDTCDARLGDVGLQLQLILPLLIRRAVARCLDLHFRAFRIILLVFLVHLVDWHRGLQVEGQRRYVLLAGWQHCDGVAKLEKDTRGSFQNRNSALNLF